MIRRLGLPLCAALLMAAPLAAQEADRPSPIPLDPAGGGAIGYVFEAWLSPHQEGGEEEETPAFIPPVFRSTAPSVPRAERPSRGHGVIEFARDFSRAWVHVAIEGVDPAMINMFHLHCGRPGQLGPILVDFGHRNDLPQVLADGHAVFEVTNADLVEVLEHGEGLVGFLTAGCPISLALPTGRVHTVAGMHTIAAEGELYLNLHTTAQTYFGDIRGQLHPALPR